MVSKVIPSPILPQVSPSTLEGVIQTSGITTRQTLDVFREHARAINQLIDIVDGSFTEYTPTVWPDTGSFGALGSVVGRYARIGAMVFLAIEIDITAIGTAAGAIRFSLPAQAAFIGIGIVREIAVVGYVGFLQAQGNEGVSLRYDNLPIIGSGYKLRGNVFYWA